MIFPVEFTIRCRPFLLYSVQLPPHDAAGDDALIGPSVEDGHDVLVGHWHASVCAGRAFLASDSVGGPGEVIM